MTLFPFLSLPIVALYLYSLRRLAFDRHSMLLLMGAGGLLLISFFHIEPWAMFSADRPVHSNYVSYIATHHALPPLNFADASRHPPTYYMVAAALQNLGEWAGDRTDPQDYCLYFSLALFLAFWVYAALTLRLLFGETKDQAHIYLLCLSLVLFWPVGFSKAGILNCDIMLYAPAMANIYYMLRHLKTCAASWLGYSAYAAGIAILAKNSALPFVVLTLCVWVVALWRIHKAGLRPPLLIAFAFMIACSVAAFQRDAPQYVTSIAPETMHYGIAEFASMFLYFNPYEFIRDTMVFPYPEGSNFHFWHFYLRTLLAGLSVTWKGLSILLAYGFIWLAMVIYMLLGLWSMKRLPQSEQGVWHYMLCVAGSLTVMVMYRFYGLGSGNLSADGRYVYPIITIIAAFYGKIMLWHQARGNRLSYSIGRGLFIGFVPLSVMLALLQNFYNGKPF